MTLRAWFEAALALPPQERAAFIEREVDDVALREHLAALLRVDSRLDGWDSARPGIAVEQWAGALASTAVRPGDMIGAFRVCEPLGQGGMGVVFRGERDEPKQQVAIKIVRRGEYDALYRQRFELERQALAALDHPYIARLIDASDLPDGTPYFVMEYVSGLPLDQYCREREIGIRERVRLMMLVCQAVAHAHRHLIVHRDLKPGNILIGDDGLPKLLDFGIAKRLDAGALVDTGTAQRFFSPRYAAPEQMRGEAASVGTDVYALGVLLFEVLAERAPFEFDGLSFGEIDRLVGSVAAPAPSARAARPDAQRQLRGDLDGIVQKCLRKSPDERFETVAQLTDDLQSWLDGMPVRARGGHRWYRFTKFVARHRVAATVGALSLVALAGAAALLWQQNLALREQRDLAQRTLTMMQDAFTAADPMRAAGADITARQILESARRKLEPLADQQPALFAKLASTIASVDVSLGRGAQAADLIGRARSAAAAAGIVDPGHEMALLHARALAVARQSKPAQAILDEIAADGATGPAWQLVQGRLWTQVGDHDRAISILEVALIALAGKPPTDELATSLRYALAEARGVSGDADGELREMDATLAWQRSALAPDQPQLIVTRMRRLVALYLAARHDLVIAEANDILVDIERIYGGDSNAAASVFNTLGQSLDGKGLNDEAIEAYRQAHARSSKASGVNAPNTLRSQFNLSLALAKSGRQAEAAENFAELLRLAEARSGGANPMVAYYRIYAAQVEIRAGRTRRAVEILTGADWERGYAALSESNRDDYRLALTEACAVDRHERCELAETAVRP